MLFSQKIGGMFGFFVDGRMDFSRDGGMDNFFRQGDGMDGFFFMKTVGYREMWQLAAIRFAYNMRIFEGRRLRNLACIDFSPIFCDLLCGLPFSVVYYAIYYAVLCGLKYTVVLAGSFNSDRQESARIQCDEPGAITHINNGSKAVKYHFLYSNGKGMFK